MDLERRIRVGLQRFQPTLPAEPTIKEENEEEPASGELLTKNKQIFIPKVKTKSNFFVCQKSTFV